MKNRVVKIFNNIKIRNKLIITYLIVAIATVSIVSVYLTIKMNDVVSNNATENAENNVNTMKYQLEEVLNLTTRVSEMIYTDQVLSSILSTKYNNSSEAYDAYANYKVIDTYLNYYSEFAGITLYVDNNTLLYTNVTKVDDAIRNEGWYKQAVAQKGKIIWRYGKREKGSSNYLTLLRSIYSGNKLVAVLAIDINNSNLLSIIDDSQNELIALDEKTIPLINNINYLSYLPKDIANNIRYGQNYVEKANINGENDYIIINSFQIIKT
jgi:two-component system sensor histidine kinase YesM